MLNATIPAGNHIIKAVQYDSRMNQTKLTLCCGQVAWLSMLLTAQYKPEVGDYWIVTDHGTQSLFKKAVFEGAVKPATKPQYPDDLLRLFLFDPQEFSVTITGSEYVPFERQPNLKANLTSAANEAAKKAMREENGYVNSHVSKQYGDIVRVYSFGAQAGDNPAALHGTAEDFGVPRAYAAAAVAFAEYVNAVERDKMQNVIKSLTAQNDKKQETINQQRKMFDRRQDLSKQLNKLIDICSERGLV